MIIIHRGQVFSWDQNQFDEHKHPPVSSTACCRLDETVQLSPSAMKYEHVTESVIDDEDDDVNEDISYLSLNGSSKGVTTGREEHASVSMFEHHVVVSCPVVSLAHHSPHVSSVSVSSLTKC